VAVGSAADGNPGPTITTSQELYGWHDGYWPPDRNNATAVAGVLAAQRSAGCGVEVWVTKEFGGLRICGGSTTRS
jgi:hypothetical protein